MLWRTLAIVGMLLFGFGGVATMHGCEQDGMEETEDAIEDTGENMEDAAEDAADEAEDVVE